MTLLDPAPRPPLIAPATYRQERRRLALEDRRAALLATLAHVREVLVHADAIVARGWVQEEWYVTRDASGRERAWGLAAAAVRPETVTRSCLLGAVVLAAGGFEAVTGKPVRRSVEALWHAFARPLDERVDWCPPAAVYGGRVRDLTRWNDAPHTTRDAVRDLLVRGQDVLARERERVLAA